MAKAKWIGYFTGDFDKKAQQGAPSPYFRRVFESGDVSSACLKISSLGCFKAFLNGVELDSDLLSPGWVDYNIRVPYIEYDITDRLTGRDCLGVVLGDGWYAGKIASFGRNKYGSYPLGLWVELTILHSDGSVDTIVSDESWQAARGAICASDIYDGVIEDANMAVDFSMVNSTAQYSAVTILADERVPEPALCPPVRRQEVLPMTRIGEYDGRLLFDCGQNMAAVPCLSVKGAKGSVVTLRYGEMVIDDRLYTANLRSAKATDVYTLSGEDVETFCPFLTYHGYRYCEVEIEGDAEIIRLDAVAVYSDLAREGSFECSSELVNKIYSNTLWSQRSNFVSIPTDCPQRDERLGWTGDAQIFCGTAMFNMDCSKFFKKYLQDMRDSQCPNGRITDYSPCFGNNMHSSPAWGDAIVVIPYYHYLMYGDTSVILDNIEAGRRWVDYSLKKCNSLVKRRIAYGDWLNVNSHTDNYLIALCCLADSCVKLSKMAMAINDHVTRDHVMGMFNKIRKRFRRRFLRRDGSLRSDTQTAYCLAYSAGLVSKDEIRPHLTRAVESRDGLLSTGFVGVKYLLPTLCDIGRKDMAYAMLTETRYPSWGYSIVNGATSIWERWNSYTIEKGLADVRMNSFNHYSYGSCIEWVFRYVLGVVPSDEITGLRHFDVRPYIDNSGRINSASGSYRDIKVEWSIIGEGKAEYKISYDHTAHIPYYDIPDEAIVEKEITEGSARFVLRV